MIDISVLENRVQELLQFLEQSASNHNSLVGRLSEAKEMLAAAQKVGAAVAPVLDAAADVIPAVAPIADAVNDVVSLA